MCKAYKSQRFLSGTIISHHQGCGEKQQLGPQPVVKCFFRFSNGSARNANQVIWAVRCLQVLWTFSSEEKHLKLGNRLIKGLIKTNHSFIRIVCKDDVTLGQGDIISNSCYFRVMDLGSSEKILGTRSIFKARENTF